MADVPPPSPGVDELMERLGLGRCPCRAGDMLCWPGDRIVGHVLHRYGEYSPGELQLLTALCGPGDTVVEAGAFIGALTVPLARHLGPTGRLIAFEPQPDASQVLAANLALNGLSRVECRQAGLGATSGRWCVPARDGRVGGNLGDTRLLPAGAGHPVRVVPLDDLALPRCHLIKADVQGMEADVLAGARQTIARHRPWLYLENDQHDRSPALLELVFSLGYRAWWHLPALCEPANFRNAPLDHLANVVSVNILCAPPGKDPPDAALHAIGDAGHWWQALPAPSPADTDDAMMDCPPDAPLFHLAARQFGRARLDDARALLDALLEREPGRVDALYLLADVHGAAGREMAAIACLRRLLEWMPGDREASLRLATLLDRCQLIDDALEVIALARQSGPRDPELALAHACLLDQSDRRDEALTVIDEALAVAPGDPDLRFRRATIRLGQGRLAEGWQDYTARTDLDPAFPRFDGLARWQGEPLEGRRLLIVAEGGHGDMIWAARFIEAACQRGGPVFLQMRPALASLLADLRGPSGIVGLDAKPADFDVYAPMLDLPGCLGVTEAAACPPPPLRCRATPDGRLPALLARAEHRLRVGIHWAGSETYGNQHHRAATLDDFLPLLAIDGVQLFSLQKGPEQAVLRDSGVGNLIIDCDDDDFSETAALVRELDLIIMTDSGLAHLAASLGAPVWLLLDTCPYWMFGRQGETTPWYPSMRLFRQTRAGDWTTVMDTVRRSLWLLAGPHRSRRAPVAS